MKKILQSLRIKLGKFFWDKKTATFNHSAPKKILFLRQDGKIGDYIVSSFVFRELKKIDPNIFIGVVCTKKDAYLFEQNSYVDKLYFVKKKNIIDYIKCGFRLEKEQYDVVVDPTVFIRNRDLLLLRLINARNYVGYKKSDYKIFNLNIEGEYHFSELYRIALEKIGFNIQNTRYDVPFKKEYQAEIEDYLKENSIDNYITVNFYGAARIKKVNNENIKKYLSYLSEATNGKQLILLSYPEATQNLIELSKDFSNVFVHNTQNIFHTIELIRYSEQLISTDTSTVHIASGFNKKIIAIYKQDPIAFTHWKPMSKGDTHILFYQENINEISPEEIKREWLV